MISRPASLSLRSTVSTTRSSPRRAETVRANWSYQWYKPTWQLSYLEVADELLGIYLKGMEPRGMGAAPS